MNDAAMLRRSVKYSPGPSFIALHELFDIDDIAERITALGGTARGTAALVEAHVQSEL